MGELSHMPPVLLVLSTLLLSTVCIGSSAAILENEAKSQAPTPVDRVIELLTEMQTQLSSEASADAAAYKEMTCWCTTNEEEKTNAIAVADDKISALTSQVEELSATDGRLSAEIAQMKSELEDKKASAKAARALREKEQAAFNGAETDMVQSVAMLRNAIQILERHASGLLQVTPAVHESLGSALQWVALKHEEMRSMPQSHAAASLPRKRQLSVAESPLFLQTKADGLGEQLRTALSGQFSTSSVLSSDFAARVLQKAVKDSSTPVAFAQQPAPYKSYNPRSGQILGILKQMLEDFESNLSESQKEELNARASYAELKESLEKEIETIAATLDEKEELHSKNAKALLDTKQDLEATRSQRAADVKFLSDLRLQCQDLDHDYATRSKARGQELKAVADAIAILTEDDARALFDKKMGAAAFVQLASVAEQTSESRSLRHAVTRTLLTGADSMSTAAGRGREQLATLAVMARLDSFTQVKEAMDKMIADLKAQQAEEVSHKETCLKEFNSNEKSTYATKREHGKTLQKIEALEQAIAQLTDDIAAANEEMAKMKLQLKEESEARKAENERFQEEMTDQRAIQNILSKAIARLQQVYKTKGGEAFAQQEPVSPKQFQPYSQSAAAGPVISMLEQIVGDSAAVEKDELAAEQAAQKSYATMAADVTASVKQMEQTVEIKTKTKAATKVEAEDAKALASSLQGRLEDLASVAEDLHMQCDYFLKNFDVRQKARLQEIEAIQSAKAYLNGMKAEPVAPKQ
mmetsp:Transcript_44873/g.81868  ORF Transcript_44873/g.81868 Transcript_44873/m.81868 type:complete len:756 (-) Transcript_44873:56-2323(-)